MQSMGIWSLDAVRWRQASGPLSTHMLIPRHKIVGKSVFFSSYSESKIDKPITLMSFERFPALMARK